MAEPEYSQKFDLQKLKRSLKDVIDVLEAVKNSFITNKLSASLQTSIFSSIEEISALLEEVYYRVDREFDKELPEAAEAAKTFNKKLQKKRKEQSESLGGNNDIDFLKDIKKSD